MELIRFDRWLRRRMIAADLRHMTTNWEAPRRRVVVVAALKSPLYPSLRAMMWVRTSMWLWQHGVKILRTGARLRRDAGLASKCIQVPRSDPFSTTMICTSQPRGTSRCSRQASRPSGDVGRDSNGDGWHAYRVAGRLSGHVIEFLPHKD